MIKPQNAKHPSSSVPLAMLYKDPLFYFRSITSKILKILNFSLFNAIPATPNPLCIVEEKKSIQKFPFWNMQAVSR